ncbi:MAG: glycosyltransferase family 2 protein [Hyphomicrobiaceae bacterium]|nr:MAG: glycosyltransferase family 2 protein [Hyphomicrobiaceae bacterium]
MIELTIGIVTYNDYNGLYFTLQALRLYHDLEKTELLIVDNYGCERTRALAQESGSRYILAIETVGTAAAKEIVFRAAIGQAVLCCDCHVLLVPGSVARLRKYFREHPCSDDLLQGPLLHDDGSGLSTHQEPKWQGLMWGLWATDPRGVDPSGEPFEISMQGMGTFSCRKTAWLGFHPKFRGFGGEEGYIHEKFRRAGRRCLCLPWFRWMHRFQTPSDVSYPNTIEDRIRNHILANVELGFSLEPLVAHFRQYIPEDDIVSLSLEALFENR